MYIPCKRILWPLLFRRSTGWAFIFLFCTCACVLSLRQIKSEVQMLPENDSIWWNVQLDFSIFSYILLGKKNPKPVKLNYPCCSESTDSEVCLCSSRKNCLSRVRLGSKHTEIISFRKQISKECSKGEDAKISLEFLSIRGQTTAKFIAGINSL